MKLRKYIITLIAMGLSGMFFIVSSSFMPISNVACAASYGRLSYTTPKKIRGTWINTNDKKSIYSKVKITAHTMTFTPKSRLGVKGKWTLYRENTKWSMNAKTKTMIKAQKLGPKYHWAKAFNYNKGTFVYFQWMNNEGETATGTFYPAGKKLKFDNYNHHIATFVKQK